AQGEVGNRSTFCHPDYSLTPRPRERGKARAANARLRVQRNRAGLTRLPVRAPHNALAATGNGGHELLPFALAFLRLGQVLRIDVKAYRDPFVLAVEFSGPLGR